MKNLENKLIEIFCHITKLNSTHRVEFHNIYIYIYISINWQFATISSTVKAGDKNTIGINVVRFLRN